MLQNHSVKSFEYMCLNEERFIDLMIQASLRSKKEHLLLHCNFLVQINKSFFET